MVHADARLLVLDKPPGLSLATPQRDPQGAVIRLLGALPSDAARAHGLAAGSLLLVHRLDVGTSGLVVLARDPATHATLSRAFAAREVRKRYLALCHGVPSPREGLLDAPLGPDREDRRRMRVDPRGSPARTRYEVAASARGLALLVLELETGRTHQIRVHLAHAGHPIVGDDLYGIARAPASMPSDLRQALAPPHPLLHAWQLELPPLAEGEPPLAFEAPRPRAFLRALDALGIVLPAC